MLRTALALATRGLHVFPCRVAGKEPACEHGCKDATTDLETIRKWWRQEPQANIAIATGAASNVFVIDVDGLDAEVELRRLEAKHGTLPATVEVITARGRHVYFQMPETPVRNSAGKIAPRHRRPWGRRLRAGTTINSPEWEALRVVRRLRQRFCGRARLAAGEDHRRQWQRWCTDTVRVTLIASGVTEGSRDNTVAKVSGHLLRRHIDPHVVLTLLQSWNITHCTPPLPTEDVERIVNSIAGKELQRRLHG
jgi:Bifunctional DNA primase/polymerase, N-terminal/Primase C terminal 1 (PriCT-1)